MGHLGGRGEGVRGDFVRVTARANRMAELDKADQDPGVFASNPITQEQVRTLPVQSGHRANSQDQFSGSDRLAQVLIGARIEACQDVFVLGKGADHDDRNIVRVRIGFELPGTLQAVHVGHHHVHDDDIRRVFLDAFDGPVAVDGLADPVPRALQAILAEHPVDSFIVDDEYAYLTVALFAHRF